MAVTAAACPPLTPVGGSWCHLFEQLCVSGVRDTFCITRLMPPEAVALKSTSAKPSLPFSGYLPHMPRARRRIRQLFLGKAEGMSVVGSGSAAFLVTRHFQL